MKENPNLMPKDNALGFLSDDKGETYNKCHCEFSHCGISRILPSMPNTLRVVWSNFEIGDLNFWRGEAYMKFFEFLDSKGGFYYEVASFQSVLGFTLMQPICSDGAMHLSILLELHCLRTSTRFTSLRISAIGTSRSSTAHRARATPRESAGALSTKISVRVFFRLKRLIDIFRSDREWYSCLNKYDALF